MKPSGGLVRKGASCLSPPNQSPLCIRYNRSAGAKASTTLLWDAGSFIESSRLSCPIKREPVVQTDGSGREYPSTTCCDWRRVQTYLSIQLEGELIGDGEIESSSRREEIRCALDVVRAVVRRQRKRYVTELGPSCEKVDVWSNASIGFGQLESREEVLLAGDIPGSKWNSPSDLQRRIESPMGAGSRYPLPP